MASRVVFEGRSLSVVEELRPIRGKQQTIQFVSRPRIAICVASDAEGRVAFVKQLRSATSSSTLELPAGQIEPGEDEENAALRELSEETGFKGVDPELIGSFFVAPHLSDEFAYVFSIQIEGSHRAHMTDEEEIEGVIMMSRDEILDSFLRRELSDPKSVMGLLFSGFDLVRVHRHE